MTRADAATRLHKIRPSGIRRTFSQARGISNAISLGLGEPDFTPPPHVLDAAKKALDEGYTRSNHWHSSAA